MRPPRASASSARVRLQRPLLERVLREARIPRASLTVLLVGEAASRRLHDLHFGDPTATDVMSFPDGTPADRHGRLHLGDLAVCVPVARAAAAGHGMGLPEELTLYILHGLLHLVGYDDRRPRDLARMWAAQRRLLATVGIALARTPG